MIATSVLLVTGCSTCCKKADASAQPVTAACPGCTNHLSVAACPGCTNKLTLDLAACPGCTNKVGPTLIYIEGNLPEDSKMIFDPVFAF